MQTEEQLDVFEGLNIVIERDNGECGSFKIKKLCDFKKVLDFAQSVDSHSNVSMHMNRDDFIDFIEDYVELSVNQINSSKTN